MNREEELFDAAADLPASERSAFLDRACGADRALRARVDALLGGNDRAEAFFATAALVDRPPLAREEKPGDRIGRYKLLQKIGEGGCGTVYMAEQQEPVRRRVALKVIKLGMDTKAVIARFEAERQALALMEHPNIARVLDAGATDTGRPFFVMELVCGIPITRYCDEENLSTAERLGLFIDVCQAIQHAHQKGIVHRDIKPTNILVTMVDDVPTPKVIDFGIAKATQGRLTDATVFTAFEQFIGTPAYMSPEQAQLNDAVDTRSDVYSLGVLLYELLTGQPPFDPKALQQQGIDEIRRIIREVEPPRPSTRLDTLGEADRTAVAKARRMAPAQLSTLVRGDLDWIAMKAIEKKRARRYDTAGGLAADVKRYLGHEPVIARPPSTAYRLQKFGARHRFGLIATATAVVALGAGLAVATFLPRRGGKDMSGAARIQSGIASVTTLISGTGSDASGTLSPDESAIAYIEWTPKGGALVVKELRTGEVRTVVTVAEQKEYAMVDDFLWAPDSQSIAYAWYENGRKGSLRRVSRHGGLPRIIRKEGEPAVSPFAWSRDGKAIVGRPFPGANTGSAPLVMLTLETGEVTTVGVTPRPGRHPRFSPDGRFVVYEARAHANRDIYVVPVDRDETVRLTESPADDCGPVFSGDGRHVLFSSKRSGAWALWAVPVENGRASGEAFPVKYDFGNHDKMITAQGNLAFSTPGNETGLGVADDVFVVTATDQNAIANGKPVPNSKAIAARRFAPAWSPDGKKLAAYAIQGTSENRRRVVLSVMSTDNGHEEFFEIGAGAWYQLFWSPDAKSIMLYGANNRVNFLGRLILETRKLEPMGFSTTWPLGFSRDGREFVVVRETSYSRVAVNLESQAERAVSSAGEMEYLATVFRNRTGQNYDITDDESMVACVESSGNEQRLVVADRNFQNKRTLARAMAPAVLSGPRWSPDRTKIAYYVSREKGAEKILHVCAADGSWDAVANTGAQFNAISTGPAWSADSSKLAMTLRTNLVVQIGLLTDFLPAKNAGK